MTKTAKAIEKVLADDEPKTPTTTDEPVLYDSRISQIIPLTLEKNGRQYRVTHTLSPISAERYFQLESDVERLSEKVKNVTTAIYAPKYGLWCDLAEARGGYKETPDWKTKTHQSDAIAAIQALLHTQVLDEDEAESTGETDLFDDDALTVITFRALQAGVLMELSHSFRAETQAEMNDFLAIQTNEPIKSNLASAVKLTKAEKLYNLGRGLLRDRAGYADGSDIPPWHLAATCETYFARQIGRMGKFSRS